MAWTITAPSGVGANLLPIALSEIAIDDSDKTLAVSTELSATAVLWIDQIRIEYSAVGVAVGVRVERIVLRNAALDVLYELGMNVAEFDLAQGESFVAELSPDAPGFLAAIGTAPSRDWMPRLLMQPGDSLRIFDSAAIDADDDLMILHLRGRRISG